jgi:outer membrane protein assembly factor BamD (BamD/ComL family)
MTKGVDIGNIAKTVKMDKNYLFIVSVDDYLYFDKLNNAVRDGAKLKDILIEKYKFDEQHTSFLKNSDATRSKIILKFQDLRKQIAPQDTLLIYFSGHGRLNDRERGFWIPHEGNPDLEATWISNSDIIDQISQINSLHTLIISDSCFSGSLFDINRSGLTERLKTDKSRWAITSGRKNQAVSDGDLHSPFAKFLFSFLNDNKSTEISAGRLNEYLKLAVSRNAFQEPQGGPLFGVGDCGGEYVFEVKMDHEGAWSQALKTNEIDSYNVFISTYPSSKYVQHAKEKIKFLKDERSGWQLILEDTLSSLEKFIKKHSKGIYIDQAELQYETFSRLKKKIQNEELEETSWGEALEVNTMDSYNTFIIEYPSSKYIIEAKKKKSFLKNKKEDERLWEETLNAIKREKKAERRKWALSYYLREKPQGIYSEKAVEMLHEIDAYISAVDSEKINELEGYLISHPNGSFKNQVKKKLHFLKERKELHLISNDKSIERLKQFIEECSYTTLLEKAENILNELLIPDENSFNKANDIGTKEAYRSYLEDFPNGVYYKEAKLKLEELDLLEFEKAQTIDTIIEYEKYMTDFPDGIYYNDAIEAISRLKKIFAKKENAANNSNNELTKNYVADKKSESVDNENNSVLDSENGVDGDTLNKNDKLDNTIGQTSLPDKKETDHLDKDEGFSGIRAVKSEPTLPQSLDYASELSATHKMKELTHNSEEIEFINNALQEDSINLYNQYKTMLTPKIKPVQPNI